MTTLVTRRRRRGDGRDAWLLVLPALIPVVLISVYPLVQGILLVLVMVTLISNLLVDLSYSWLDPRIRYS
jgi:ABC-type dipeptide/oligopeptide/nickel transport system permease component